MTKTRETERVRCVCRCKVDKSFPASPCGILKIIEMILGLIALILIAVGRNSYTHIVDSSPSTSQIATMISERTTFYTPALQFCLAAAILAWLLTILMFLLFLFCVPEVAGGAQIWNIIDLVLDIIFVIFYLFGFILICIACGMPTDHSVSYSIALIVAIFFALILLVLYILSLVFCVFALMAKRLY